MEEEQPFRERRYPAQPEIPALDVSELVTDRHALMPIRQRRESARGQQDYGRQHAGDERRLHILGDPQRGDGPNAQAGGQLGCDIFEVGRCRRRAHDRDARPAPAPDRDRAGQRNSQQPRRQHRDLPRAGSRCGDWAGRGVRIDARHRRTTTRTRNPDDVASGGDGGCDRRRGRRQDAERQRRQPDERDDELGGDAPPQQGACGSRQPRQPRHRPDDCRDDRAVDRCAQENGQHQRSFRLSAFNLATRSSSSRSSASETCPASAR